MVSLYRNIDRVKWLVISFALIITEAFAGDSSIDFNKMMAALRDNAEPIMRFTIAIAYVIGIWMIISSIIGLKRLGQSVSAYSPQYNLMSTAMVKLVVGILLIYLPTTIDVGIVTFWGNNAGGILTYTSSDSDQFGMVKEGVIAIVRVVGLISLVKGLIILSRSAGQSVQQGTFSRGLLHVIGGILAINIVGTLRIIGGTLGISIFD